ncbi:helix-turn-helix domain-containing protein [Microbacterium hydrocarbonoxydans]|uniref:helix-turn-helix domain-containing protein n=1 Tax=Microbacterium hydrocarbonoxydans TaxID=273678 RepID=UPI0007BB6D07|nr:helix-turn-helix transcriptional regulator [Microbacterium hydrocarbonoxydans]GAT74404.1 hypothetical protein MHM582_2909 [Microbacterium sp. HM58-2]
MHAQAGTYIHVRALEAFRVRAGLSRSEVLSRAGMTDEYLLARLRREEMFTLEDTQRLAEALGTTAQELATKTKLFLAADRIHADCAAPASGRGERRAG